MNNLDWNKKIKSNFDKAASNYRNSSSIQNYFSSKIVLLLKEINVIPQGECVDLGSGPGFLADEIEKVFPKINVKRVDFSKKMLLSNKKYSEKILWDLNKGLPPLDQKISLLVSSFCIHWLNKPEIILKDWFKELLPGGLIIVSFPTNNCFPEWKETCKENSIEYSGLCLPKTNDFKKCFKKNEIFLLNEYVYKENFSNVFKLFKNIRNMGAHATQSDRKTVKELKQMQKSWPKDNNKKVNLTWEISIIILKKS